MTNETQWCHIERTFDAPIERVWDMWTKAELFASWYGPNGMSVPIAEMDVTLGGRRKICMEMKRPDKTMTMWFVGEYKEIDKPNRLVYTESMSDEDGNIIPPSAMGMPEGHPEVTEIIVELTEKDGQTYMTMVHIGVPAGTPGEGGWHMAFEKLAVAMG